MSVVAELVPLWLTGLLDAERARLARRSGGTRARLALVEILRQAGESVSLVTAHTWSRAQQGQAYLWARARLLGQEDLPVPEFIVSSRQP